MLANEPNSPHSDMQLVQAAFACASPEQLQEWVAKHYAELGDSFFMLINSVYELALRSGDTERAEYIQEVTDFIRLTEHAAETDAQGELLFKIFDAATKADRQTYLRSILPKITPRFFILMAHWAGPHNREGDIGIAICEELLDLMEFNDLREDWSNTERIIIWGSVRFMHRTGHFGEFLTRDDDAQRPLLYDALRDAILGAVRQAQYADMASLGLAVLNVVLELSPRAVVGPPVVSRADVLRFETLALGAKIILLRGGPGFVAKARRLLLQAQAIAPRLDDQVTDEHNRTVIASNKIAILDLLGELALLDHDAAEAVRFHHQALEQHVALIKVAAGRDLTPQGIRAIELGLPNSLAHLAQAEILTWQLEDAALHIERAIAEYRRLSIPGRDLAGHLLTHARIEFLRTNFETAEALLNEAKRLQQADPA